jgi:UDP-N-acetylmuramate--alanine ligase
VLAERIAAANAGAGRAEFAPSVQEAIAAVVADAKPGDLVITQGAGSVSQFAPLLLEALKTRLG